MGEADQNFNPRPLAGATSYRSTISPKRRISIHAPLRGRPGRLSPSQSLAHFNPRPLAGATHIRRIIREEDAISIHAPLRGRRLTCARKRRPRTFQSTPPCGGDCQTGQLEFYKRFRLFSRKSVHGSPKPHFPVLVPSVRFPFALTAPWELLGHRSFWLPGAGFCSDTCFPGCRTASCRGLCQ